ncbi:MAG: hypothetical protein U0941_01735 [Planctomycetaceae bacterium]
MSWKCTFVVFGGLVSVIGCGHGGVKEETIQVKAANDPLHTPKSILQRYAEGQAFGSEVSSFPAMVESVRKVDKERADILEKGLDELQKASEAERPAKAKELLSKLQPSML